MTDTSSPRLPDVHAAEPIPQDAWAQVEQLLSTADLFRYTAADQSPVALLEAEFAQTLGAKYAVAVASCSAALFLAMKALDLPRGAKVLIPAFTFAAVPSAVVHADCTPVLVDVAENFRIDLDDFHRKIEGADAVLISHMRGHTSDMDAIAAAAQAKGIPLIEDAAHSLGTTWGGQNIGTIGTVGAFSFQSYKMLNAGEGGILVTDDANVAARAIIMSGAYEHNWAKHGTFDAALKGALQGWQNKLPLYNTRLNNLSATLIRPQLQALPGRVARGRRNHDHVADRLNAQPWFVVPPSLPQEQRAPDSLQFHISEEYRDLTEDFARCCAALGFKIQVFGLAEDNARAFWNWQFLDDVPELPQTKAMLMSACDVRLPTWLDTADCDAIADVILRAGQQVFARAALVAE